MWRRLCLGFVTVVLYIFISSVVIVLAQGYTVDLRAGKFLATGLIEIDTFPRDAKVSLDSVDTKKTTPVSLSHYIPGTYAVEMEFSGYQHLSFPVDIVSELVTHVEEVVPFPNQDNWRNLQLSSQVTSIQAFPNEEMFLVQSTNSISWWGIQKSRLVKMFVIPTSTNATYSCVAEGSACIIVDGNQAYFADLINLTSEKLKAIPVFHDTHSLYKFHEDYVVFAKQNNDIIIQRLSDDGMIETQIFEENIEAYRVFDQNVWFVKDHTLWRNSLISGLPQKIATIDTSDAKVENLFVMPDYIIWQTSTGEIVLFDSSLQAILNSWPSAKIFDHNGTGAAIIQDAKIWLILPEKGLLFLGQATDAIDTIQPYSTLEWIARLHNGHYVLVLVEPARILPIENDYEKLAVIPYKGILATKEHASDTLFYHLFPEQSWINKVMNN